MLSKKQNNHLPALQLPQLLTSVTSQGSISNFVAQTPKQARLNINFRKISNPISKINEQKENNFHAANSNLSENHNNKNQLPYKMIASQLPSPCSNHPERQSSFYIQSDEKEFIFYCQKCAILVASQGFQVKKIQSHCKEKYINDFTGGNSVKFSIKDTKTVKKSKMSEFMSKQQKQTQLTNFLNNLQRIQSRIDKVYETNQTSMVEIDSAIQTEGHRTKQLFLSLHKVLDEIEQSYFEELQNKALNMRQPLQITNEDLTNDINTLESMKQDICQTYDDIINQTTSTQFQTVMSAYKQNVSQIQTALNGHQNIGIPLGGYKKQAQIDIKCEQIVQEIQKEIISRVQAVRRQSIKSTKRRMSIAGSKIR